MSVLLFDREKNMADKFYKLLGSLPFLHPFLSANNEIDQIDFIHQFSQKLSGKTNLNQIALSVVEDVHDLMHVSAVSLLLKREKSQVFEYFHSPQMNEKYICTDYEEIIREETADVFQSGAAKCKNKKLTIHTETKHALEKLFEVNSILCIPLISKGFVQGVLCLLDVHPNRFRPADQKLILTIAGIVGTTIENARLWITTAQEEERWVTLQEVTHKIGARPDPQQVYRVIHKAISRVMPVDFFMIALVDGPSKGINAVYLSNHHKQYSPIHIPEGKGLSSYVIKSGHSICLGDFQNHAPLDIEFCNNNQNSDIHSVLAVPLTRRDKIIGMISVQSILHNAYSDGDLHMLEMIASHASTFLENAHLFEEVQRLAITDSLTGLYNRLYFDDQILLVMEKMRKENRPLSLIMLDPDFFKEINDCYGHQVGDAVLTGIARLTRQAIRNVDIAARYGGDEYVIILPDTNLDDAHRVAKKIHKAVLENTFFFKDKPIQVTISEGVTSISGENLTIPEEIIKQADMALYDAKQSGRNQIGVYTP